MNLWCEVRCDGHVCASERQEAVSEIAYAVHLFTLLLLLYR